MNFLNHTISFFVPTLRCFALLAVAAVICGGFSGCQQGKYDVVVLKSKVKQLERELAELGQRSVSPAGTTSTPSPEVQADIIDLKRKVADLESQLLAARRSIESMNRENVSNAVAVLEDNGANVSLDESGHVVTVDLTQFPVDDETFAHLRFFSNIRELSVSGPWVTPAMFDVVGQLTTLQQVDFSKTIANTSILEKLTGLRDLKYIQLFRADIDDDSMRVLSQFENLEQIRCGQTRIGDEGLQHLQNLTSLRAIDLSDCNRVSDQGLEHLSQLPDLKFVKVWGPQVGDPGMAHVAKMASLEVLGLNDTQVTDEGIRQLAVLNRLKELHLVRTRIGDPSLEVFAGLTELQSLRLRDTQITDDGLVWLAELPKLENLDLSENSSPGIGDPAMEHVAKIQSLQELNLWTTQVTDAGVQQLTRLPNLTWLNLDKTQITDRSAGILAQMPQLTWLHLGSNELTDESIESLKKLSKLKYINLSHTQISQEGFFELSDVLEPSGCIVIPP